MLEDISRNTVIAVHLTGDFVFVGETIYARISHEWTKIQLNKQLYFGKIDEATFQSRLSEKDVGKRFYRSFKYRYLPIQAVAFSILFIYQIYKLTQDL